ncbi:MAG: rolling circle replication-associated protein [Chthoniobacterales bacterium]
MASVVRSDLPLFCTLTYPSEWTWDVKLWKRHLKIFSQRFLRRWQHGGFVWKLEFQKRGAPHFHPFVWGISNCDYREFMHWISDAWNEIAGDGDPNHLLAGTRIERLRHAKAAIRYVSGYASKTDQTRPGEKVGRYWGVVGRDRIPWGQPASITLDKQQSKVVLRTVRRFMISVNRESRINRTARLVGLDPNQVSAYGWFQRERFHYGKHLRGAGRKLPPKLRLRNLRSMNVFLDADFWMAKLQAVFGPADADRHFSCRDRQD